VGTTGSVSGLHTEVSDLFSINYLHKGAAKYWYIVPSSHATQLEQILCELDPMTFSTSCQSPLRHKTLLPHPDILRARGIPVYRIEQHPGEIIVTLPRAYHWSFNVGLNMSESANFALPSWISFDREARSCTCRHTKMAINISMDPFTDTAVMAHTRTHLR